MEKTNITEIITKYFKAVCDAYSLGNVESSYNAPIMALFTDIGCAARDLSGERKGQSGEILISSFGIPKKKLQKPNLLPALKLKRLVALIKGRSLRSRLKLIDMATLF